jgi:hypothetical protein
MRLVAAVAELGSLGIMRITPFILLLVLVSGCASFPKHMTGQFNAQRSDFIVIKKDGALYWSPAAKTKDRLTFVGIGAPDKDNARLVRLVVPSASPFLSSSVRFSPDYSRATVDWGSSAGEAARSRSAEYDRVTTK